MNEECIRLRKLYGRGGDPTAVRALVQLLYETFEALPGPELGQCAIGWAHHPSAWPWLTVRLGEAHATVEVANLGGRRQPKQGWRAQFKDAIAFQAPAMVEPALHALDVLHALTAGPMLTLTQEALGIDAGVIGELALWRDAANVRRLVVTVSDVAGVFALTGVDALSFVGIAAARPIIAKQRLEAVGWIAFDDYVDQLASGWPPLPERELPPQ